MSRRLIVALLLAFALVAAPGAALAHEGMPGDMPPGVHDQAHSLMAGMMQHMQEMVASGEMSPEEMEMMMAEMHMLAEQLPPGTFLALVRLMATADHESMMELHALIRGGGAETMSAGELLAFAQQIVRR